MTDKVVEPTPIPPANWGHSETAATVGRKLYPDSGPMLYRVMLAGGTVPWADIEAATGDDAAAKVLARHGGKVVHVEPAPQQADAG